MCDLEMEVYDCKVVMLTLVLEGQSDDLILGSSLLRYLDHHLKLNKGIWSANSPTPIDE